MAMANPRFRDHIPLMIGGGGEKKTFALAARHFDHLNIIASLDDLPRKMDALKARCDEADRDPATLETSLMLTVIFDENLDPAEKANPRMVAGGAAQIADQIQAKILDVGVGGVIINLPNGHTPGVISAVAEDLAPVAGRVSRGPLAPAVVADSTRSRLGVACRV